MTQRSTSASSRPDQRRHITACALLLCSAAAACRTTVYVSDPSKLPPDVRAKVVASASPATNGVSAEQLAELYRLRRVAGELISVLASRDVAMMNARYGLREDTPEGQALVRLLGRRSGPPLLEIRTLGDPILRSAQPRAPGTVTMRVNLDLRYRSFAGREESQQMSVDLLCIDEAGQLQIVTIVPVPNAVAER